MSGCKCAQCFGLAEYMAERSDKDYGLPAAPGHSALFSVPDAREELEAKQRDVLIHAGAARRRVALPWELDAA